MAEKALDYIKKAVTVDVHDGKATFTIFPGLCKGCGLCKEKCPERALDWSHTLGVYGTPTVSPNPELCKACRICEQVCPDCAIAINRKGKGEGKS